jgi:hypothetical protein
MADIKEAHVEWRIVDRLRDMLDRPPGVDHDETLAYSLFTTILCWTCQRIRDDGHEVAFSVWGQLQRERAMDHPWSLADLNPQRLAEGALPLSSLPAHIFLVGLRNAGAHGDDRKVRPRHVREGGGANRRLIGFDLDTTFYDPTLKQGWGRWLVPLTSLDMRRIGVSLADRFCNQMGRDAQEEAGRHVLVA